MHLANVAADGRQHFVLVALLVGVVVAPVYAVPVVEGQLAQRARDVVPVNIVKYILHHSNYYNVNYFYNVVFTKIVIIKVGC